MKVKLPTTRLGWVDWFGSATGLIGSIIIASNIAASGYGYIVFLLSSTSYVYVAIKTKLGGLTVMNITFTFINFWGIWNWLIKPWMGI